VKDSLVLADRTSLLSSASSGGTKIVSHDVSQEMLSAVERALLEGETHYTVRPGFPELRRRIAQAIIEAGGPTPDADDPMDNVLITSDVSEALFVVLLGLGLSPGPVLVSSKDGRRHAGLFSLMGMEIKSAFHAKDVVPPIHLVYREWDSEIGSQERALSVASARNCPDIVDLDLSLWLRTTTSLPPHLDRTLFVGNLDALTGLSTFRVAYLFGPKAIFDRCRPWKQALSICGAAPSQRAALHALETTEEGGS
jgi:aspartate/methionine/tyrosine aminotransferase